MVKKTIKTFFTNTPLETVLVEIAETDDMAYPVVDDEEKLIGIVSLSKLRRGFMSRELNKFLLVYDMMEPPVACVTEDTPLSKAVSIMNKMEVEFLPVVTSEDENKLVGMLERQDIHKAITRELMRRQQVAQGELGKQT